MAQQSVRRGRENQSFPRCFKHARVTWTRSANSHTGPRQTIAAPQAGQMAASDYAFRRSPKSTCAEGGVHRWKAEMPLERGSLPTSGGVKHKIFSAVQQMG